MSAGMCVPQCMHGSHRTILELILCLHHVGSRDWTRVIRSTQQVPLPTEPTHQSSDILKDNFMQISKSFSTFWPWPQVRCGIFYLVLRNFGILEHSGLQVFGLKMLSLSRHLLNLIISLVLGIEPKVLQMLGKCSTSSYTPAQCFLKHL